MSMESQDEQLIDLRDRCMILESQVASLAAFACALMERHPQKDQIMTRWGNHLGPAMQHFLETTSDPQSTYAAKMPGFVLGYLDSKQ